MLASGLRQMAAGAAWRRAALGVMTAGAFGVTSALCDGGSPLFSARVLSRTDVASTKWLKLQSITYQDPAGKQRLWDMCTRTTRPAASSADAVVILARLPSRAEPAQVDTLLVMQFRPPVGMVTIELPAGLIDEGESPQQAAVRELKEETGFTGTVAECSGVICMSPGLSDESVKLVTVDVDLDAPENRTPEQALDETETIQVRRVPLNSLAVELERLQAAGAMPWTGLFMLVAGLRMGQAAAL